MSTELDEIDDPVYVAAEDVEISHGQEEVLGPSNDGQHRRSPEDILSALESPITNTSVGNAGETTNSENLLKETPRIKIPIKFLPFCLLITGVMAGLTAVCASQVISFLNISRLQTRVFQVEGQQASSLATLVSEELKKISCAAILEANPSSPSGSYNIRSSNGALVKVYCNMGVVCGRNTGGWMRVVNLDFNKSVDGCPRPWQLNHTSPSGCISESYNGSCDEVIFPTWSISYSRICGRVTGYRIGETNAFNQISDINTAYIDGISITRDKPRQHVWTLAAGYDDNCPCSNDSSQQPPAFVGANYFCDDGNNHTLWYAHDQQEAKSCDLLQPINSPPWFQVSTSSATLDDLGVRLCTGRREGFNGGTVKLLVLELYVK